jgi:endoglucanase
MTLEKLVEQLCSAPGLSGREDAARSTAVRLMEELELGRCEVTPLGSLLCYMNQGENPVMLEAHLDQVGMVVTNVEDGFFHVANCGGIDRRLLPAQRVTVHTAQGPKLCVVASTPPHLKGDEEGPAKWEDILLDTGYSAQQAKEIFAPSDAVTAEAGFVKLAGDRVTAPALDDRAGCAAVILAAKEIAAANPDLGLHVVLSAKEETGGQGAKVQAFRADPTEAIVVDVTFGIQEGVSGKEAVELGKGPAIGYAPLLDRAMMEELKAAAKRAEIPFQIEIMGRSTGTNADAIAVNREGVRCGLVSIPQRSMHTPVEVCDLQDIENTAKLMARYVLGN